jgi:ribosomal protein S18 acetylase RimI-like enzyme
MTLRTFRAETVAHYSQLRDLLIAYEADLPSDLRHNQDLSREALDSTYSERSAAFLVEIDDQVAGCVAVSEGDLETAVLKRLFVRPRHRGAGAARALVEIALVFMRERGYRRVVLDTEKRRLRPAYELYRSFGFEECAAYGEVDYRFPTFMELKLTPGQ